MNHEREDQFGLFSVPSPVKPPKTPKKPVPKRTPDTWLAKSWRCGILSIDAATNSGWAIWVCGRLIASGEVHIDNLVELTRIVEDAQRDTYRVLGHDCVVLVLERPFGKSKKSNNGTLMAIGAAHHAWRRAWDAAGCPKARVWLVYPPTWRSRLFGKTARRDGEPEDIMRQLEQAYARKRKRKVGLPNHVMPDEAPAICIGRVACRAPELRKILPAHVLEAAA